MPDVDAVLRDALVLIDPMQNPDGRARFVFQNLQGRAAAPDPTPYNAEHDEPWPGGRSNHYLFDMNRDWFAQTQPETRGRIQVAREYWPHVTVDLHEQGGDNTLLLRAAGRSAQPAHHQEPGRRPSSCSAAPTPRASTSAAGRTSSARSTTRFYPGYGDSVADLPRIDRHDLRAGLGAGLSFARERRHGADLSATA